MLIDKHYIHGYKQHRGILKTLSNICYGVVFAKSSYLAGNIQESIAFHLLWLSL